MSTMSTVLVNLQTVCIARRRAVTKYFGRLSQLVEEPKIIRPAFRR